MTIVQQALPFSIAGDFSDTLILLKSGNTVPLGIFVHKRDDSEEKVRRHHGWPYIINFIKDTLSVPHGIKE